MSVAKPERLIICMQKRCLEHMQCSVVKQVSRHVLTCVLRSINASLKSVGVLQVFHEKVTYFDK